MPESSSSPRLSPSLRLLFLALIPANSEVRVPLWNEYGRCLTRVCVSGESTPAPGLVNRSSSKEAAEAHITLHTAVDVDEMGSACGVSLAERVGVIWESNVISRFTEFVATGLGGIICKGKTLAGECGWAGRRAARPVIRLVARFILGVA